MTTKGYVLQQSDGSISFPQVSRATIPTYALGCDSYGNLIYNNGSRVIIQPRPNAQLSILRLNGASASTINTNGVLASNMALSGGTTTFAANASGTFANYATLGVSGQAICTYVNTNLHLRGDQKYLTEHLFALIDLTNVRFFIGLTDSLTSAAMVGSDNPAVGHVGIQFSTARGDTNFQFVYKSSSVGTQFVVDTGIAPNASKFYSMELDNDGTNLLAILYDSNVSVWSTTISSNLPAASSPMGWRWSLETLENLAKNMRLYGTSTILLRSL